MKFGSKSAYRQDKLLYASTGKRRSIFAVRRETIVMSGGLASVVEQPDDHPEEEEHQEDAEKFAPSAGSALAFFFLFGQVRHAVTHRVTEFLGKTFFGFSYLLWIELLLILPRKLAILDQLLAYALSSLTKGIFAGIIRNGGMLWSEWSSWSVE